MDPRAEESEDEEEQELKGAFTLVHEAPDLAPLPGRGPGGAQLGLDKEGRAAARQLQLGAFPPLFGGETDEARLARADASVRCWDGLAANIQVRLCWQWCGGGAEARWSCGACRQS